MTLVAINASAANMTEANDPSPHVSMVDYGICLGSWAIAVFIIGGNLLILSTVVRVPRLRTLSNFYIASLAVADCLVGILLLPLGVSFLPSYEHIFRDSYMGCMSFLGLIYVTAVCSGTHMLLVSIDRFLFITKPFVYMRRMNERKVLGSILGAWVGSFICGSGVFVVNDYETIQSCNGPDVLHPAYNVYTSGSLHFLLGFVTSYIYTSIMLLTIRMQEKGKKRRLEHESRMSNTHSSVLSHDSSVKGPPKRAMAPDPSDLMRSTSIPERGEQQEERDKSGNGESSSKVIPKGQNGNDENCEMARLEEPGLPGEATNRQRCCQENTPDCRQMARATCPDGPSSADIPTTPCWGPSGLWQTDSYVTDKTSALSQDTNDAAVPSTGYDVVDAKSSDTTSDRNITEHRTGLFPLTGDDVPVPTTGSRSVPLSNAVSVFATSSPQTTFPGNSDRPTDLSSNALHVTGRSSSVRFPSMKTPPSSADKAKVNSSSARRPTTNTITTTPVSKMSDKKTSLTRSATISSSGKHDVPQTKTDHWKAMRLFVCVFGCYFTFWLPFYISLFVNTFQPLSVDLLNMTVVLGLLNSGINFLVYTMISKDFRAYFKRYLCRCCLK